MPLTEGKFTEQKSCEIVEVHGDLSQQVVQITVDKLTLMLHQHAGSIEQRKSWVAPLGIFLTVLVVLVTTEFKDVLWPADTWNAVFIIVLSLSGAWLVRSAYQAYQSIKIDDLVEKIKRQA